MHSHYSEHAPAVVCTLLHNFVQQEHAPPGFLTQQPGGSIVFSIAGMFNSITLSISMLEIIIIYFSMQTVHLL